MARYCTLWYAWNWADWQDTHAIRAQGSIHPAIQVVRPIAVKLRVCPSAGQMSGQPRGPIWSMALLHLHGCMDITLQQVWSWVWLDRGKTMGTELLKGRPESR